ncbi:hypothetical protein [uncultured Acetatifactor sp.]|nr:hypothetical protein [uncultured Acetatifactor sp.]
MGAQSVRCIQRKDYLDNQGNELRDEILACNQDDWCRERTVGR